MSNLAASIAETFVASNDTVTASTRLPKGQYAFTPTTSELLEYMPLVHQTVARFLRRLPPNVMRDDLVAAGTIGLVDALRKNGVERGPTFEWYARTRIRGAIVDELRAEDWLTRRARSQANAISEESQTSRTSVVGFDDLSARGTNVELADRASIAPLAMLEQKMNHAALAKAVTKLPEREQTIIRAHYFEGVQFKVIAEWLKVSEPRVSQLHSRAVATLRAALIASEEEANDFSGDAETTGVFEVSSIEAPKSETRMRVAKASAKVA
jgi:RNA polymerase sigma factor for flagellar operon FliA